MIPHWSLRDSKSPQVSMTFFSILANLNNAVFFIVSTRPLISKSSSQSFGYCTKSLNYNWHHSQFHVPQFFQFLGKVEVLIFFFFRFHSTLLFGQLGRVKSASHKVLFFLLIIIRSGWSQQCSNLHDFHSFSYFQLFQSLYQSFGYYYYYYYLLESVSHQRLLMVFHWSRSDSKSPQISRTFLSILADLNNVVVWMVSTGPFISKSTSPFYNPSVTVPRTPITIGIIFTLMFQFFNSLVRSTYLSFFSLSFNFTLRSVETEKSLIL